MVANALNLTVLAGEASGPATVRELPSGRRLGTVSVRVRLGEEPATSVPVAIWDPPAWLDAIEGGEELVVLGRVVRRFFRSGAGTGSRVEVEAATALRAPDRRRREATWRKAAAVLEELLA